MRVAALGLLCSLGCPPVKPDRDGDGVSSVDGDCDDEDASVLPGGAEQCNHQDDNCDGQVDEGVTVELHADEDGDGYGAAAALQLCPGDPGAVDEGTDCDDSEAGINPGELETCGDGQRTDCGVGELCRLLGELPAERAMRFTFSWEAPYSSAGRAMPDLDGDGLPELLFGQWSFGSPGSTAAIEWGSTAWGPGVALDASSGDELPSGQWWDGLGWAAERPWVVLLRNRSGDAGLSLVDPASPGAIALELEEEGEDFATGQTTGDFDGDGLPELAVSGSAWPAGAAGNGAIWVLNGAEAGSLSDGLLDDVGARIEGADDSTGLGRELAAGDADGDGRDELYASAFLDGAVYRPIFLFQPSGSPADSTSSWARLHPDEDTDDDFASSLLPGEWDGAEGLDLIIGAPEQYTGKPGEVRLVPGPISPGALVETGPEDVVLEGLAAEAAMGRSLAALDYDGDGQLDLAATHAGHDSSLDSSRVDLLYGPLPSGDLATWTASGEWNASYLDRLPDMDGDGTEELLIATSADLENALYFGWGD